MKKTAKAVAVVLISMIASVVTAQTTSSKNEQKMTPATLTAADIANITAALPKFHFEALEDSLWRVCLTNGNTPLEGTVAGDGMLCGTQVKKGDDYCVFIVRTSTGFNLHNEGVRHIVKKVVVQDRREVERLDTARVNTQFVTKQRSGKPQYGVNYHYTSTDGTSGDIHEKRQDKYGVSLVAGGDYNLGGDVTSFGGRVGLAYSVSDKLGKWSLKGEVDGILRRTRFNENAEQSGEPYTAYATELRGLLGYAFGTHGEWRVMAGPTLGWEFYRTDSQETINEDGSRTLLKSWGNFIYYGGVARVEYDWANSPVGFFGEAGYRMHKSVFQNADMQKSGVVTFSVGVNIKLWRHQSKF
jgi:hypothetical protein